ncbi:MULTISPECIES: HAD-IA family hydrolase [Lentibacter]|jgi:putative hydrolase of the HAD superfamily|uniref:Putative hydrolase of the HAD superfamily n=1 Tax=Lentibacter algarum TaxID=576131 RepID=A0A1H3H735_9RHOB|nr:HAD-IA family hydrolase [Lentibacter algarum]MCO4776683.1 HAD-IA family hydrolase [Lentibacter algarum]MCO4826772.1 HAD-IA family hydrolase [Lentibacter algarum]WIF30726.1 Alpha-D-glucose-1-phosphate phosphatase YihX [Lentibacter algarum]SDY11373.1 putative hydrolase of the HAD superfamily [Lentibacter algarum]
MNTRALILDFGGVISRTLFETHDLSEKALGLPNGSLTWQGPFAPEADPLWRAMQADEISERDYWKSRTAEVAKLVGQNWNEMSDFVRAARGADPDAVIRPEFRTTIAACKAAGVRLAILSNELDLFYGADFREKLPFLKDFEVIVDATYTGILKPDARAYEQVLQELGLPAADCVFVDDQLRNIKGAEALGLPAVHFDVMAPSQSYAEALRLLDLERTDP